MTVAPRKERVSIRRLNPRDAALLSRLVRELLPAARRQRPFPRHLRRALARRDIYLLAGFVGGLSH